jgi:glyoxylase-like metal-dependent hydrolase (beta-lactamase superfamily II)
VLRGTQCGPRLEVLVTHTHMSTTHPAAWPRQATGAPVLGRLPLHPQWQDATLRPPPARARRAHHGGARRHAARAFHTPGHASNHLCYLLEEEKLLLTGDHVMQGSTVVINPPDGDMAAYLAQPERLLALDLDWLAPGHGFLVASRTRAARLIAHRLRREAKVREALRPRGQATLDELLPASTTTRPPRLHPVARRSLLAHLLKLRKTTGKAEGGG